MEQSFEMQVHLLQEKISHASTADRIKLQPSVQKMVDSIMARGHKVPLGLSRINADLIDEAFDDRFDNMPL